MKDINDVHQFNMLPMPEQIKVLRTTILQRLRIEEPTLRDQFAMAALTGLALNCVNFQRHGIDTGTLAKYSYQLADAMMEAREK